MAHNRAIGPPPVSSARWSPVRLSYQRGDITQVYLSLKSRFCGRGVVDLIPGMPLIHRIPQRIVRHEGLAVLPVIVIRTAQQDTDVQVDIHQIRGHQFAIHHHAGSDEHLPAPLGHVLVGVIAVLRDH